MFDILIHFALVCAGWRYDRKARLYTKKRPSAFCGDVVHKLVRANAVQNEFNFRYAKLIAKQNGTK